VITASSSRLGAVDSIQKLALKALGADPAEACPFAPQPYDMSVSVVTGSTAKNADRFFLSGRNMGFRVATSSYWDCTNYFEPLSSCGRYYFYMGAQPLNARYFSPSRQSDPRWSVLETSA